MSRLKGTESNYTVQLISIDKIFQIVHLSLRGNRIPFSLKTATKTKQSKTKPLNLSAISESCFLLTT